ncbi:MAG: hypothetical protein O3B64_02630 [bacterium]|nr:hypothetical protein [bacterium]MDA1024381.1 hypothetical protein [bacterium]
MKLQTFTQYAGLIAIIAIGVAVGVSVANAPGETNTQRSNNLAQQNFDYLLPHDWERTTTTEVDLNTYLGGDHSITFGIVEDPTDANVLYFATSDFEGTPTKQNTVSIIRYQQDTYEFERIFKATYEGFEPFGKPADWEAEWNVLYEAHVLGYDNGKLVLFFQDANDSPGRCAEPIVLAAGGEYNRNVVALDLEKPYGGFIAEYTLPEDAISAAIARQDTCLNKTL